MRLTLEALPPRGGGSAGCPKKDKRRARGGSRDQNTQIDLNKQSLVNPKSTSNQSSKSCTVLVPIKKSGAPSSAEIMHGEALQARCAPGRRHAVGIVLTTKVCPRAHKARRNATRRSIESVIFKLESVPRKFAPILKISFSRAPS